MQIVIAYPGSGPEDAAEFVEEVASLMRNGFVEGRLDDQTHWRIEGRSL